MIIHLLLFSLAVVIVAWFCLSVFVGNTGGAIYAFGSNVTMTGRHNISHNTGTLHGGGLSLQFWSRATFTNVIAM